MDKKKIEKGVMLIIEGIGEDPKRAGIKDTPRRVADMYEEIFSGLKGEPEQLLKTIEGESHDEMILIKDLYVSLFAMNQFITGIIYTFHRDQALFKGLEG